MASAPSKRISFSATVKNRVGSGTFKKNADGSYTGTAGDVVGEAHGEISGNTMFLKYVLRIPYGGRTIDVTIDDRMYQTTMGILINESKM